MAGNQEAQEGESGPSAETESAPEDRPELAVTSAAGDRSPVGRLRRITQGQSGNVVLIMLGSAVGQLVALAVSPILTRIYTPEDFGLLNVFVSVASVLGTLVLFRLDAAIPLPDSDRVAASVAWLALTISTAMSLVIGLLGPVVAPPLGRLLHAPELPGIWWLVVAAVFMIAVDQVLLTWMVREKRYRALAVRNALQGIGQSVGQVALGWSSIRSIGLLVGWIVGRIAAVGGLFSSGGLLRQGRPTAREMAKAGSRYRRFPLISSWSALINSLGQYVPQLVIGALYGLTVMGEFALTVRIIAAPVALIGQAVSRVFQGEASAAVRDRNQPLRTIIRSNAKVLLVIGAPICVVLMVAGPWLFGLVFGPAWVEAGQYARFLAVGFLAQLAVSPVSLTLLILQRQGAQLAWDVLRLVITTGAPVLVAVLGGSAVGAVAAMSAAYVVCYGILFWVCERAAAQHDATLRLPKAGSAVPTTN